MIVYEIKHDATGRVYVGQTTQSLVKRWRQHCEPKRTECRRIGAAIRKYGKDEFSLRVLAKATTREELDYLEQYFIIVHNAESPVGFNLKAGGNGFGHSEETRKRMSQAHKGKPMTGRAAAGVPRGPRPPGFGAKVSAAKKGRPNGLAGKRRGYIPHPKLCKPVVGVCVATGESQAFESVDDAARFVGVSRANISAALNGRRAQSGGCVWMFVWGDAP